MWDGPVEVRLDELKRKMKVHEENLRKLRERYQKEHPQQDDTATDD